MALDIYEQSRGVYVDRFGNQVTYFNWGPGEPDQHGPLRYVDTYNGGDIPSGLWNDMQPDGKRNIICMKCSGYYSIPTDYECPDSDFGVVVVKAFNGLYTPTTARDKCTSQGSHGKFLKKYSSENRLKTIIEYVTEETPNKGL